MELIEANTEDDRTCCICLDASACSKLPCRLEGRKVGLVLWCFLLGSDLDSFLLIN